MDKLEKSRSPDTLERKVEELSGQLVALSQRSHQQQELLDKIWEKVFTPSPLSAAPRSPGPGYTRAQGQRPAPSPCTLARVQGGQHVGPTASSPLPAAPVPRGRGPNEVTSAAHPASTDSHARPAPLLPPGAEVARADPSPSPSREVFRRCGCCPPRSRGLDSGLEQEAGRQGLQEAAITAPAVDRPEQLRASPE